MKPILDEAYEKALEVIRGCAHPHGLYASGGENGYNAVWSRDSMISLIGASVNESNLFKNVFKASMTTLADNQGPNGQIANCVDKWSERKPHVDFQSIDSSLWFIIGNYVYASRYGDKENLKENNQNIGRALRWLSCQDSAEVGMLVQQPTSDWQDAFPHRYGHTINTQALYYHVLNIIGDKEKARHLKYMVNEHEGNCLWNREYYLSYRWKNHRKYTEKGDWFDSLGNLLAIVFNLADKKQAEKILDYIEKKKIDYPYACRAINPPIGKKSEYWQDYYLDCDAGKPDSYLNGGIWPFIGGFYVLALIKLGRFEKAEEALEGLAKINLKGDFPEWVHPKTKECRGDKQAWSAGTYILAYESLKLRKVLF